MSLISAFRPWDINHSVSWNWFKNFSTFTRCFIFFSAWVFSASSVCMSSYTFQQILWHCCCILITVDGERSTDVINSTCFTLTRTPSSSSTWPRASPSTLSNKGHIAQKIKFIWAINEKLNFDYFCCHSEDEFWKQTTFSRFSAAFFFFSLFSFRSLSPARLPPSNRDAWSLRSLNKQCICRGNVSPVPTFPSPSAAPGWPPPRPHCHWRPRWPRYGWPLEQRRRHQRPPSFLPRCCCCWSFSILLQSWLSRSPSSKFKVLIWSDRCYLFQLIFILALHLFNLSSHLCLTLLFWRKPEEQVETLTSFITNSEIKFE